MSPIAPVPMPLFTTMGSLQEVLDLGESKLPIKDKNELNALLMTYHNTLLVEVTKQKESQ